MDDKLTVPTSGYLMMFGNNTKLNPETLTAFMPNTDEYKQIVHHRGEIVLFKGAYVSGFNTIIQGTIIFKVKDRFKSYRYGNKPGKVLGHYTDVIAIGHHNEKIYGHFVMDVMSPVFSIPEDIRKRSYIVILTGCEKFIGILKSIGFDEDRVVVLDYNEYVFATNLYTCWNPRAHGGYWGPPLYRLSKHLQEYYNTTNLKPTYIGFHKRVSGFRVVANIFEIMELAKQKYPNENIVKMTDSYESFASAAKIWAEMKIVVASAGSNLMNAMYMHPQTCILHIAARNTLNFAITAEIITFEIFQVMVTHPKMTHLSYAQEPIDPEEVLKALDVCFYVIQNKKWPEVSDYHIIR
ncbi:hypothetical protein TVAG_164280 [Trichomonas vaginalis G3]|uniref:Glycosyltransferase 61 catalytic domain-containing protein n=1 Tax=Trichomonas vaginalis (strain ATCC PRA-98 / G3) TaxID=412133 RepID=A2E1W9_TRIV3|nr:glycosyltransferase family [Trichomonas vaginalis G3]EAY13318.1 hypothetical protein TVAG_164280 [Trichomonas vaginalis G3]KAI5540416.1 glycosyltransferase family [Trichomonas vaginalis G3]|eukprot:XP_001325541.1 hypothetical protein [Trichomonas vaginalis G3]